MQTRMRRFIWPPPLSRAKTKIARRVIEVLEYFALGHDRATVMDVARKYGRPQSSTSELLSSMVEMGLLYKEPLARFYAPTPAPCSARGCRAARSDP